MTTNKPYTTIAQQLRDDAIDELGFRQDKYETALRRIAMITATALQVPQVSFFVLRSQGPQIVASFGRGMDSNPVQSRLCTELVLSAKPLIIENLSDVDIHHLSEGDKTATPAGCFAGVPVRSVTHDLQIGAFCIYQPEARKLTLPERRLLGECAGLIEDELALRQLSVRDELTGLLNRREFDLHVSADLKRAYRGEDCLSAAILDIDYFKRVNDTFGHARGDEVLQEVASLVQHSLRRDMDSIGRFGGEEFSLSLPGLHRDTAYRRLCEICTEIARRKIPNPGSPFGVVTASFGVISLERPEHFVAAPAQRLMTFADEALYRAKAAGRNRVCIGEIPRT